MWKASWTFSQVDAVDMHFRVLNWETWAHLPPPPWWDKMPCRPGLVTFSFGVWYHHHVLHQLHLRTETAQIKTYVLIEICNTFVKSRQHRYKGFTGHRQRRRTQFLQTEQELISRAIIHTHQVRWGSGVRGWVPPPQRQQWRQHVHDCTRPFRLTAALRLKAVPGSGRTNSSTMFYKNSLQRSLAHRCQKFSSPEEKILELRLHLRFFPARWNRPTCCWCSPPCSQAWSEIKQELKLSAVAVKISLHFPLRTGSRRLLVQSQVLSVSAKVCRGCCAA